MVTIGVIVFAGASALCGATPTGDVAEAWMIVFRVIQGAGAAIMFPAALAIVVAAFPLAERGKAMAIFFGITGGLTAVGPIAGGYLTEWTWRAIFWVNVPVAIVALILTARAKPAENRRPGRSTGRGTGLIAGGMGLSVLGLQQSSKWGWGDPATLGLHRRRPRCCWSPSSASAAASSTRSCSVQIFKDRGFAADNAVLFLLMIAFVPVFFFASLYAQISLGDDASGAGLYLLVFFGGFAGGLPVGRAHPRRARRARGGRPGLRAGRGRASSSGPAASPTSTWATTGSTS